MSHNEANSSSINSDTLQTNLAIPQGLLCNSTIQSTVAPSEPNSVIPNNLNINIPSSNGDTLLCQEIIEANNDANINNPNNPNSISISIGNTTNLPQSNSTDLYDIKSINIFEIILDHPQAMNKPVITKINWDELPLLTNPETATLFAKEIFKHGNFWKNKSTLFRIVVVSM